MSIETNKALIRRWIDEGWNGGSLAVVDAVYAPDVVQHDAASPLPVTSAQALAQYVGGFRAAFPDLHFTVDDLIAEGDRVVWRFTATATHRGSLMGIPPSGRQINVTGIVIFRVASGKIAEVWVNYDTLGMLQKIGAIPTPA